MGDRRRQKELKRKKRLGETQRASARLAEGKKVAHPRRACGDCKVCCTAFAIPDVETERGEPCQHECDAGCAVYAQRPVTCANFKCAWLMGWGTDGDRPDRDGHLIFSDPNYPRFARLAGAGSMRHSIVRIRDVGNKSALQDPKLMETVLQFVAGSAAVLLSGDDETDGRWISLYGPRLLRGLTMTWEELEKLASGAECRCVLCASPMAFAGGRMRCQDVKSVGCVIEGPSAKNSSEALVAYYQWARVARVIAAERPENTSGSAPH